MTSELRDLVHGLDPRERAVLVAIYKHKVLVTERLKAMFFGSLHRAQDRLRNLAQRGLIDTWYPPQPQGMGKASDHHTLTENGAQIMALSHRRGLRASSRSLPARLLPGARTARK